MYQKITTSERVEKIGIRIEVLMERLEKCIKYWPDAIVTMDERDNCLEINYPKDDADDSQQRWHNPSSVQLFLKP